MCKKIDDITNNYYVEIYDIKGNYITFFNNIKALTKEFNIKIIIEYITTSKTKSFCNVINKKWWRMWDSNPRPPACRAGALAS